MSSLQTPLNEQRSCGAGRRAMLMPGRVGSGSAIAYSGLAGLWSEGCHLSLVCPEGLPMQSDFNVALHG